MLNANDEFEEKMYENVWGRKKGKFYAFIGKNEVNEQFGNINWGLTRE